MVQTLEGGKTLEGGQTLDGGKRKRCRKGFLKHRTENR